MANERELIDWLASLGFKGDQLEKDILEKTEKNMLSFTVRHRQMFDAENMYYWLQIKMDPQFNSYRLQSFKAAHQIPPFIKHNRIGELDTSQIEQRLKELNWQKYLNAPRTIPDELKEEISDIRRQLDIVSSNGSEGREIRDKLMLYYLPEHFYDLPSLQEDRTEHLQTREFSANEYGTCTAVLAYHIISGRLDDLYNKLRLSGMDNLAGFDLYGSLIHHLNNNPESFVLQYEDRYPEGLIQVIVPVNRINGWYKVDTYTVKALPFVAEEDHKQAARFEEQKCPKQIEDSEPSVYERMEVFSADTIVAKAINMLFGRAVFKNYSLVNLSDSDDHWVRLDLRTKDVSGHYPIVNVKGFSVAGLEKCLKRLLVSERDFYRTRDYILSGERILTELKTGENVFLESDPESRSLLVSNQDLRIIPFNFHLDPDWKPPQKNLLNYLKEPVDTGDSTSVSMGQHPSPNSARKRPGKRHGL